MSVEIEKVGEERLASVMIMREIEISRRSRRIGKYLNCLASALHKLTYMIQNANTVIYN